ncbi:hypothetical protein EVJ24_14925 [Exiguobacterium sp. SH1S21]|uniref:hypothetical protein n=1 Tax=Exiguobacterium sp. SH1S21 TaxID=2510953 RepID=UPI00103CD841|nr:hypothetical protein [Exiguobacterium sp. SH1S21]TCI50332.1 hypothetical protein EVJ24_14925 [Exiguobacterium sp. SH1S21]
MNHLQHIETLKDYAASLEARFEEANTRIDDARARKEAANQEFEVAREQADVEAMKNAKADLVALTELEQHFVKQRDALKDELNGGFDSISQQFQKTKNQAIREFGDFQREKYEAKAAAHIQALHDLFVENMADQEEFRAAIKQQASRLAPFVKEAQTRSNMANLYGTDTLLGNSQAVRQAYGSVTQKLFPFSKESQQ